MAIPMTVIPPRLGWWDVLWLLVVIAITATLLLLGLVTAYAVVALWTDRL